MMTEGAPVDHEPGPFGGSVRGGALERLERVVQAGEARLDGQRADLAALREVVRQLSTQDERPTRHGVLAWQVLPPDLVPAVLRQLLAGAVDLVRASVMSAPARPGFDPADPHHAESSLAGRRVRWRTLYPVEVTDTEAGRAFVAASAALGEEQRVSLAPPSEFVVIDDQVVVATAEWGNTGADHVVIRDPMLVAAFSALFDRAFAHALPIPRELGAGANDEDDLRLVRLLGLGLKDESIARYLGCSLRTVRRRVAHLMEIHDAQTRFQLGVAVAGKDAATLDSADAAALARQGDR
jgi:hypothetical protein